MNQGRLFGWTLLALVVLSLALVPPGEAREGEDELGPVFHEMNPGSFLVFPLFDIREGYATQIRITNLNRSASARVQFNFICPGTREDNFCDALDRHESLTPYETFVLNVADYNPPCEEGYVVAFVENGNHEAIAFDHLIGSYHIAFDGSREAAPAIAIQSLQDEGTNLGEDGELDFGTGDYKSLPSHLFTDFQAVQNGAGSELILLTLDAIAGGHNPIASVDIRFWNEREDPFSTSWQFVCWTRVPLERIDFNFFADNLGSDYGAIALWPEPKCPVAGGCPPLEEFNPTILGAIDEFGSSARARTKRNLFHDKVPKGTVFFPR
ncbi:hypothetical protein [Candidatus Entotheonella palauensis]|uniref:Uncharacterized protein n=1 Tax=Candidatus Entotheonella gemina TaxID=1429439 RepID=W4LZV5_9BACT|nr:hypothetical protein [Candidatus Entotheonella palauensis]ETX02917.1 MAG: hypothetical protein ETSY2_34500 [Candidatus Entotheonella gemina]